MENTPNEILIGSPSQVLRRAAIHYNKGEFAAAAAICREVIGQNSENADAFYILGHIAIQANQNDNAVGYFVRAVSIDPADPRFNRGFAEALGQSGRGEQAINAWSQYLILKPTDSDAHSRLAQLLVAEGRIEAAVDAYQAAVSLAPENHEIHFNLIITQHKAGLIEEAIAGYETLLLQNSDWAACHNGLAAALRQVGENERAIIHAERAIELAPKSADAHNNLGLSYFDIGDTARAVQALKAASQLQPDNPEVQNNFGVALAQAGQLEAARYRFLEALALRPLWAEGHLNLANVFRRENRLDDAVEHYQKAIEAKPDDFRIYGSFALAQLNQNQPGAAIANYRKALEIAPEDPELHKGLGIAQLLAGNLEDGWKNYEWRLLCGQPRIFDMPRWNGEDLEESTLLVHAEQGFGDTIQFCRYLLPLARKTKARKIILECQQSLVRLLQDIDGPNLVFSRGSLLPAADYHVPLMSLPAIFSTTLETIPAPGPYLKASASRWQQKPSTGKPNVGIIWKGNPLRQDDSMRSCPLSAFAPLLNASEIECFSLQIDASPEDSARLEMHNVRDLAPEIGDFADTAAIIAKLDMVISVDTAAAHLCGGLGKPVWVLLEYAADWRYLIGRDDSPWYPSMRLFRQRKRGDWDELMERVATALGKKFVSD